LPVIAGDAKIHAEISVVPRFIGAGPDHFVERAGR
jgi:hypothetical protein